MSTPKRGARAHGHLISAIGMIGSAAMQVRERATAAPQAARAVLPNCLKTEIIATANLREWRHIFRLRRSPAAHPDIRGLMDAAHEMAKTNYPVFFEGE